MVRGVVILITFCIALLLPPISLLVRASLPLLPLLSSKPQVGLAIAPNRLNFSHIFLVISLLLVKPCLKLLGLVPPLRGSRAGGTSADAVSGAALPGSPSSSASPAQGIFELPKLAITMPLNLGEADFIRYQEAILEQGHDEGPVRSSILILPAITTPLMSLLLARRSCPILPLGSVNVRNRFEFLAPAQCRNAVLTGTDDALVVGRLEPRGRRVKRGVEVDIVVEIITGPNHTDVIFRQTITILQFLKRTVQPRYVEGASERIQPHPKDASPSSATADATLYLGYHAPSSWALVCKDYNPIHVSSRAAKMFGFPGKIAHGNLVVARALEQLLLRPGMIWDMLVTADTPFWLEVDFKKPVVVPMQLDLKSSQSGSPSSPVTFEITNGSKTFIEGVGGWL